MANLNNPVRLRDHHSTVHLPIPSGCSTTALSTVLGQGAYKVNHHFPSSAGPNRASDFHQLKNYAESSPDIQRSSDSGFQSADASGIKANAHNKPDQYIAVPSDVESWRKSNCPVPVHSVDDRTASIKSQSDVSSKPMNDTHCGGAIEHQQSSSAISVLPQPTPRISSAANIKPGNVNASLSDSFIRPLMVAPTSSNSTSNHSSTTNKASSVQVDSHENTSGFNKQNAAPKEPLPHWNMRLANVMHYPKYNTRKNSGFERRLKHTGLILDPKLTLRLLRKVLQPFINNAVNNVIQHYMEEYILLAVRNIRDNLGESAVTEKDLVRFRRSVIQRVALQYFAKEDLPGHGPVEADFCVAQETRGLSAVNQCSGNSSSPQSVNSPGRLRSKRSSCPARSLHRKIVEHNWNTRLENGFCPSTCCSPSSALSPMVSEGPDSLLDDIHPALHDNKTLLDESITPSNSAVSSPAISDRLRLASLKVPPVTLNEISGSVPVSSQSTSPHTPSSASSSSTLGYFFGRMSQSEDDDQPESNNHLPLPSAQATSESDLVYSRRSKRNSKRPNWWHWGSTRRSKPKRARCDPQTVATSQTNNVTVETTTVTPVTVRHNKSPHSDRQSFWNTNGQSSLPGTKLSSAHTAHQKGNTTEPPSSDAPRFTMNDKTLFTLGSSANTWLGMGAARGRIYTKHPELFRYQCDAEDKAWLVRNGLLVSHGVKAYLMHSDQVKYIGVLNGRVPAVAPSAKDNSGDSLPSFTLPSWLVIKISNAALNHRSFFVEPQSSGSQSSSATNIPAGSPSSTAQNILKEGKVFSEPIKRISRDGNPGLNNESKSRKWSPNPSSLHSTSDNSDANHLVETIQQPKDNSNSDRGLRCRLAHDLDVVDGDTVTELPKDSGCNSVHQQHHNDRHKVNKNARIDDICSSNSELSHNLRFVRPGSGSECPRRGKSPKSPPTLQRFDYT